MKHIIIGIIMIFSTLNANELANEQSPYLQQHKNNPVNWMPWSAATLMKAKKENKLIFLSIGYSTCHWCHVMEAESFEKEEVAKVVNQDYIAIKVDREEMPQLDSYYQNIYQIMNSRGGGWPLTIIMTPDAKPFWSATYVPRKNLISVLTKIKNIYQNEKEKITQTTEELHAMMQKLDHQSSDSGDSDLHKTVETFVLALKNSFDEMSGGFGVAPKFPRATLLESILDLYSINHDKALLQIAEETLKAMAEGGIYDQIESGFYRYSVDGQWHIPHFEKMLYTQAELLRVYTKAYLITHNNRYKKIIDALTLFVSRRFDYKDMLYSASDADSLTTEGEKEEGYYFVFTYEQTYAFLKAKGHSRTETEAILQYFHITKDGNFEHESSNPHIQQSKPISHLEQIKLELTELRATKPYPFIDTKILTSWNSMYISSLILASKIDTNYASEAIRRLEALLENVLIDGKLYHQMLPNKPLKITALFEDYAFLVDTLVDAYEIAYDSKYITLAETLSKEAIKKFYDHGSWNLSDDAYKTKSSLYDSAYASPVSVMTRALFKLSLQTDNPKLYEIAKKSISQNPTLMQQYPDSIASAFDTFIGYKNEYKILKSERQYLIKHQKEIATTLYPYLLSKAINLDSELYLGCAIDRCFVTDRHLEKVLEKIKKEIK